MPQRFPHLAVKQLDQLCSRTALLKVVTMSFLCFTTTGVLVMALSFILCEVSVHVFVHIHVQAKNSSGTIYRGNVFKFESFAWSLHAPSLSFHSYVIIHSCWGRSLQHAPQLQLRPCILTPHSKEGVESPYAFLLVKGQNIHIVHAEIQQSKVKPRKV